MKRLIRRILDPNNTMEEHFSRQAEKAAAEIAATKSNVRKATLGAFLPLDPHIGQRYKEHLARNGDPVLAELATFRDMQELALAQAFAVLDDHIDIE